MNEEEYVGGDFAEISSRVRDIEEKNRIAKDRIILIAQNLIDMKEETQENYLQLKKEMEEIKHMLDRIKSFVENASQEFSRFARKEDVEILSKQAKMFQPLEFVRKKDLKNSEDKE